MTDQSLDQQILQDKINAFEKELQELETKHGIVIIPTLNFTPYGIVPQNTYMDKSKVDAQVNKTRGVN